MVRRFERYAIAGLAERPEWWLVRPREIESISRGVRRGGCSILAETPGGYPVVAVAFGGERPAPGTATWASASNSRNPEAYRTGRAERQAVVLVCGVHGAEAEAVAGAGNLIRLLDGGRDLRGEERPRLAELAAQYRIVVLPCVNMDGRAVSPDHLRGVSEEEFRRASQGVWEDGSPIGYPGCKEYAPLPLEKVMHPGGYPNAAGYNIMHDICPGDVRTREAEAVLRLVADEQADLILHMHSHGTGAVVLPPPALAYPLHVSRIHRYQRLVFDALEDAELRPGPVHGPEARTGINLTTGTAMASGGLSPCLEQPAAADWSFEEMLETFYAALEVFLAEGTEEPFSPRHRIYEE